jgi:hypothetical protein
LLLSAAVSGSVAVDVPTKALRMQLMAATVLANGRAQRRRLGRHWWPVTFAGCPWEKRILNGTGSYDLFVRKAGWKPQAALIVSPYVEREFFQTVARDLRPKRLHVVIDDGCRREDLQTVSDAVAACGHRRPPALICKLGSASGLVHMKLFYILWRTSGGQAAHSLVFGSANATRQGFSGIDNAELVARSRLTASRHADAIRWCSRVIEATNGNVPVRVKAIRDVELARGMHLRLPAITVGREVAGLSSFDLWVQRGRLLSAYRPDPTFLHVPVHLAKGLPQTELANLAIATGFTIRQTKRLRYRYVAAQVDGDEDEDDLIGPEEQEVGNWRRKLFVWTHLGDWCSEGCFDAHQHELKRRGFEERVQALEQLEALRALPARRATRDRFLGDLAKLWDRFGDAAPTLLRGGCELDLHFYGDLFDERVERDLELSEDLEFRDRFVRGFELVQVPRFRSDVAGWKEFVESLARQLVLDSTRGRSQSKLLKAVREAFKKVGTDERVLDDHKKLITALRDLWRHSKPRLDRGSAAFVVRYHEF